MPCACPRTSGVSSNTLGRVERVAIMGSFGAVFIVELQAGGYKTATP